MTAMKDVSYEEFIKESQIGKGLRSLSYYDTEIEMLSVLIFSRECTNERLETINTLNDFYEQLNIPRDFLEEGESIDDFRDEPCKEDLEKLRSIHVASKLSDDEFGGSMFQQATANMSVFGGSSLFSSSIQRFIAKWIKDAKEVEFVSLQMMSQFPFLFECKQSDEEPIKVHLNVCNEQRKKFYDALNKKNKLSAEAVVKAIGDYVPSYPSAAFVCLDAWDLRYENGEDVQANLMIEALKVCKERMAFIVPAEFCFRQKYREAREKAVLSRRLYSVINLPSNTTTWTSEPLCLYLFEAEGVDCQGVIFASLTNESVWKTRSSRKLIREFSTSGDSLADMIENGNLKSPFLKKVEYDAISGSGEYPLVVNQHVLDGEEKSLLEGIKKFSCTLKDVAEVVRPPSSKLLTQDENGKVFYEVRPSDFNLASLIDVPEKKVLLSDDGSFKALRKATLRPGDIVFCVKGAVGSCGLAPEEWDFEAIPSPNCVVIRVKSTAKTISAGALMRYFRSKAFAAYLGTRKLGNRIPSIPIKVLEDSLVPSLTSKQIEIEEVMLEQQEFAYDFAKAELEKILELDVSTIPEDWH